MSAYLSAVVADLPVHYWRCADQGGGLLNDIGSSPRPLHMQVDRMSFVGYSGPNSDGGSADFALQGLWATTLEIVPTPAGACSVECLAWVFGPSKQIQFVIWDTAPQISLQRELNDHWTFVYNNTNCTGTTAQTHRAWHHIVGTYDGVNMRVYIDGALQNTVAVAAQIAGNSVVSFGANINQTDFGDIFLSEVAFYTTTLSGARVTAHFNAIDNIANRPVFGGAGGLGGGGSSITDPNYVGILQQILQSVRKLY